MSKSNKSKKSSKSKTKKHHDMSTTNKPHELKDVAHGALNDYPYLADPK